METGGSSPGGPANMFSNAHNVQITGGTFSIVQGNVQNSYEGSISSRSVIWRVLQAVPNFRKIYLDMLSKATEGTGMWLFKNEKFRIWLEANGDIKIFWGSGMPGAGKTVLASLIIQHLDTRRQTSPSRICVCYVYFRYSDSAHLTLRGVLESLLKQTLERHPECLSLVENVYAQHLREGTQPSEAQILGVLRQFTDGMEVTFYVLDALDEAPPNMRFAIIRTLASLNVKLFITSRPLKDMQGRFPAAHTFIIAAQDDDIEQHVNKGINESFGLLNLMEQEGDSLYEEIISVIKLKSSGMFLHASLQTDALRRCISLHQVRRTLNSFPSQIEDVYLQTWQRIHEEGEEGALLVKSVLLWVLNASRSMTLRELESAVAASPQTFEFEADRVVPGSTVMAMCRGLLVVEEESQIVRLVHYTAKDHLERLMQAFFPLPHSILASVCMTHLTKRGFQNTDINASDEFATALRDDPLLAYASDAWDFHVRESLHVEATRQRAVAFVRNSSAFPAVTSRDRTSSFDILSSLHMVAFYRLPLDFIPDPGYDANITTKIRKQSLLMVACLARHDTFLEVLLTRPDVKVNMAAEDGWSSLMIAAVNGYEHGTSLLLVHPDIQVNLVDHDGCSALFRAAYQGYEHIVTLLLNHPNIQVNIVDNNGWSALIGAAYHGNERVALVLLAHPEIDAKHTTNGGWPALICACHVGHVGTVRALLTHQDINANDATSYGFTALMTAAVQGHDEVVALLLTYPGVVVNCVDSSGCSALMAAAQDGRIAVVSLLLGHPEIEVNLVDQKGLSALIVAVQHGQETVTAVLLDRSETQINLITNAGWTALIMATYHDREAITALLLARSDIEVNLADQNGWSPLIFAIYYDRQGIITLLLDHHTIDVNHTDNDGWSVLMFASHYGRAGAVKALLALNRVDINLTTSYGFTPLMAAALEGHESVVEMLLLAPGIDSTVEAPNGATAISLAQDKGHIAIIKMLEDFQMQHSIPFTPSVAHKSSQSSAFIDPPDSDSEGSECFQDAEDWVDDTA